jgi:hypothetical protein
LKFLAFAESHSAKVGAGLRFIKYLSKPETKFDGIRTNNFCISYL